jgi:polyphosphate kinase 2 (PPK2 family)
MKIEAKDFRVREGDKVNLEKWPTKVEPVYKSKEQYKSLLEEHVVKLAALQELHYASNRHAVLVIFQATDAAGKDGAIRHVMSGVNPQGCRVYSFKQPSEAELAHDAGPARARPDRDLQPILLRGSARDSRASRNSRSGGHP